MKKYLIFLFLIAFNNLLSAQKADKEAIKALINKLFEGMQKSDSAMAYSVFHPSAKLNTIGFSQKTNQNYFVSENRVTGFLEAIAKPKTELLYEKATSYDIKIDGNMAEAWVPYTFHLGSKFSHCGVDNFVLFKEEATWKIIYLVDTTRKDNCAK
jgi:Putative lumazine-binding